MSDAHAHLCRALAALAEDAAVAGSSTPWASATYVGLRHAIRLTAPASLADMLERTLPDHEFSLPGHLVADLVVVDRRTAGGTVLLEIEALTIEAC